jgi:hypothetical protein
MHFTPTSGSWPSRTVSLPTKIRTERHFGAASSSPIDVANGHGNRYAHSDGLMPRS